KAAAPSQPPGFRSYFSDNQGSQTEIRIGFRAPGRNNSAEPAAEVLTRLLDEGMSSRLYSRICDEKGLCYSISASYEPFVDDGLLDLAATVRHDRAPLVVRELCGVVSELADCGPTEEELHICKKRYRWGLESVLDDVDGLADYFGLSELDGFEGSLLGRCERIERVTRDDVVDVARLAFCGRDCAVVGLGMLRKGQCKDIELALHSLLGTR
ncbi:MAG: insulinase family protein, partial [Polyangiaceae bacterium]|nr:insulinase family protein [Polyangiaceae bacterium]